MVDFLWVWLAAGGGVVVGMFLFAVMSMAAHEAHDEDGSSSAGSALT